MTVTDAEVEAAGKAYDEVRRQAADNYTFVTSADHDRALKAALLAAARARPVPAAEGEVERLRAALAAIQRATVAGKVCDDVAWFDGITTLYDFCDLTLHGSGSPGERVPEEGGK